LTLPSPLPVRRAPRATRFPYTTLFRSVLAIVADGMGGHNAGEVASSLAVRTLENKWNSIPDNLQAEDAADWIKEAINEANKIIFDHSRNDAALEGMGTTIVLAI